MNPSLKMALSGLQWLVLSAAFMGAGTFNYIDLGT